MKVANKILTKWFHCFNDLNRFDAAKKNVWEIAMIEQMKWREETMIIRLGFLKKIYS